MKHARMMIWNCTIQPFTFFHKEKHQFYLYHSDVIWTFMERSWVAVSKDLVKSDMKMAICKPMSNALAQSSRTVHNIVILAVISTLIHFDHLQILLV